MTHSFHWSRLAEIAEAEPMPQVAFPTGDDIALLRRNLRRMRELLSGHAGDSMCGPAGKGRPRAKGG
jgi:hypothetical protein